MATEKQIAANWRNARKSTGPRSRAGKKRASGNSYRHGLSYGVAGAAAFAEHVDALAQKIAGRGADDITLEMARAIARAELDLVQIRRVKVALIARMSEFGELEVPNPLRTCRDVMRFLKSIDRGLPTPAPVPPSILLQNLSAQLRPCVGRCRNCSSLTVTRDAQPLDATGPVAKSPIEKCFSTINSCGTAKRSQFYVVFSIAWSSRHNKRRHRVSAGVEGDLATRLI
jgi:hypothetical protein